MHPPAREHSYQHALRTIGILLDQEQPRRFTLIEVTGGFTLVTQQGENSPALQEIHFTAAEIQTLGQQYLRGRRVMGNKYSGSWRLVQSGRQDFLRALGFELDDSQARSLTLDELDDGMLVTYSYIDPTQGFQWRKQMNCLQSDQMRAMVHAAHRRRHKRSFLRR